MSSVAKISFLGGASAIGASCALVETDAANILVDCGIRFQPGNALPDLSVLSGKRLDAVVLTHAHTDHTGALPVVCDAFPGVPVHATSPTADLVTILMRDALKLMGAADRDADVPLYNALQVERAESALRPVNLGDEVEIYGVRIRWFPASHILGASMVHLSTPGGQVLFTGDYSVSAQATVPGLTRPTLPVDVLVSESTYGERLHEDRSAAERRLISQVKAVVEAGGRVLIPAFAIGRAQEVLRILKRALAKGDLPPVPVYVDGMVRAVCDVYARHPRWVSRQLEAEIRHGRHPFYDEQIQPVTSPAHRAEVVHETPAIFVASSGMLSGGASVVYARAMAPCPNDAILITGYQDEESPGRALLNLAKGEGPRTLRLGDETVEVRCQVASYGLSAHADRLEMAGLIEAIRPRSVVLVHGDGGAKEALARSLSCRDVVLATDGEVVVRRGRAGPGLSASNTGRALPGDDDIDRIRALLGPPSERPVRDRTIGDAWFGADVHADDVHRLATELERRGLVRRDDNRRNRLWVLAPNETDAFPDEADLEVELKAENPKGELLELCMRARCSNPTTDFSVEGAFHVAVMSWQYDGEELRSEPHRSSSRKLSEQLAARELLAIVERRSGSSDTVEFDEVEGAALQTANPKGKLLEHCARQKLGTPEFVQEPSPRGYAVRAVLLDGSRSRAFVSRKLKLAEHAAARELLDILLEGAPVQHTNGSDVLAASPAPRNENARMRLNELRQVGIIDDFGYELLERSGPSHQPIFVMGAWATVSGDEGRLRGADVRAGSKKDAERVAAEALMDRLREEGLVGRG